MTSQTGINRDFQNWISQVAVRKSSFWFLISQLWFSDFQGLRFAISDFWILVSDFWFLNSDFKFQSSDYCIAISNIGLIMASKWNIHIYNNQNLELNYTYFTIYLILESGKQVGRKASWFFWRQEARLKTSFELSTCQRIAYKSG